MHSVALIIKVCAYLLCGYAFCCAYYQGLCLFIMGLCILLRLLSRFVVIYYGVMHSVALIIKVCAYLLCGYASCCAYYQGLPVKPSYATNVQDVFIYTHYRNMFRPI
jgi:hypothetical protein